MNKLLILYPPLFRCESKFRRKVNNVTQKMGRFDICWPSDPNDFIAKYVRTSDREISHKHENDWKEKMDCTHALLFDDGEEFSEERDWLQDHNVPIRWIKVPLTRVINIQKSPEHQGKKSTATYEYIGRGSYWGNPYSMFEKGESREEVIGKFEYDFKNDKFPNKKKSEALKLMGKRLGCFCKPAACHGDILAEYLNSYDDGK